MTEESTAKLHLEDSPRLHVRKLLELVALIEEKLEPIGCQQGILQSDQAKEDARDNRPTPVTTTTRPAAPQTTSSSRCPQESIEIIARMLLQALRREARQGQEVHRESC